MGKTIAVIGALDTKGEELRFVKEEIERRGHKVLLINTGVIDEPLIPPDIPASEVAEAGGTSLAALRERKDRGEAMKVMAKGAAVVVARLHQAGKIDGILGMGGSAGTAVGTAAMRALPVGFPKVMVSTVAAGDTRGYVGTKDIVMIPSVVDISGINRISRQIFTRAAGAICGMVEAEIRPAADKPMLAASMFGNSTKAVDHGRAILEKAGYEVLVFHSTGVGGATMESLVEEGYFDGIFDITTTEWADEVCGGVMSAGPNRGDAAARRGIPQVIAPGCVDMVNFWARSTVPEKYRDRQLYEWNPNVTLMRTNVEENIEIGKRLAEKANASKGPVAFLLPLKGVSILDSPGNPFWNPEADQACFRAIKENVRPGIHVEEIDCNLNDPEFAERAAALLLEMLQKKA
ncbi:MAG TPA: Tm-1-like ATP-binding domain-containing protein [Symbiobacteriaceae bacterium]